MAGNKISTKRKEDKSKTTRNSSQTNEDAEDVDFSLLRKPILTSITGFSQARKIFDLATEELKGLISNECDLLYECKVCRNIFRSLVNFISHKRIYCKEKFSSSLHGHFIEVSSVVNEITKIKQLEEGYQESLQEANNTECNVVQEPENERIPLTKDLSAVIERIAKQKAVQNNLLENQQVVLQKIPKSSVAVYQNISYDEEKTDSMKDQIQELNKITSQENAIMQSDGKFKTQSNLRTDTEDVQVIQISDDDDTEDSNSLKCKACDLQFATQKTLRFHIKYKHLENRLVYPCPDCLEIFSTSWSVYRHLFKVHRKTAAQIRRLRESIQAKAFRMDKPPAYYEKRKTNLKNLSVQKKTEEERLDQENQDWMESMEADGELPRCGGCGRTFERRAALAAHTNTCQPRSRALARRPQETKKIEIQIRKDYNKGPPNNTVFSSKSESTDEVKDISPSKPVAAKENNIVSDDNTLTEAVMDILGDDKQDEDVEMNNDQNKEPTYENKFINRLPFAYQAEKSNLHALKQKMEADVDIEGFLCKKCDVKCNDLQDLLGHMASHYNWKRYGCKLCNYKHYEFVKLPEHIKTVHKLKGDTDFYFSTLKALDGTEALEMADVVDDAFNDTREVSPNSRRPSRCSSDSSRLSDDSSSSGVRIEMSRKRKMAPSKIVSKKKKDSSAFDNIEDNKEDSVTSKTNIIENDSSSNSKTFEENSSDMDDNEDKTLKSSIVEDVSSVASRRSARKKIRPKYKDFEYDLSNLLKMEAQGYRDSQISSVKSSQNKKKTPDVQNNYEAINKEFSGALATLSRKSVEHAKALMKNISFPINTNFNTKAPRMPNIFARPSIPKVTRIEKSSPKKENAEVNNDNNLIKQTKATESQVTAQDATKNTKEIESNDSKNDVDNVINNENTLSNNVLDDKKDECDTTKNREDTVQLPTAPDTSTSTTTTTTTTTTSLLEGKEKSSSIGKTSIQTVFPFKFGKGLEVMKNPLIKKNLTDFTKAGMKTKILVIKPINRNKDGTRTLSTPLKFQTIKLKDPNKDNKTNEEKNSDQVVLVPVPKVDCTSRPAPIVSNIDSNIHASILPTTSKSEETAIEKVKTVTSSKGNGMNNSEVLETSIDADQSQQKIC